MRTRKYDWFDEKSWSIRYSFQVMCNGKWCNPGKSGMLLVFATEEARDKARADARKIKEPTP